MQDSVILISTAIEPGARSSKRTASTLYGDALARAGLSVVLYAGGDPIALAGRRAAVIGRRRSGTRTLRSNTAVAPTVARSRP